MKLNVSNELLSKNINNHYKTPFRNLINKQRIELAKFMLADSRYDDYSIEGIAITVGYANKSTFYNNFKTITGVNPAFYKATASKLSKNASNELPQEKLVQNRNFDENNPN